MLNVAQRTSWGVPGCILCDSWSLLITDCLVLGTLCEIHPENRIKLKIKKREKVAWAWGMRMFWLTDCCFLFAHDLHASLSLMTSSYSQIMCKWLDYVYQICLTERIVTSFMHNFLKCWQIGRYGVSFSEIKNSVICKSLHCRLYYFLNWWHNATESGEWSDWM